jgi:hypothetical protein
MSSDDLPLEPIPGPMEPMSRRARRRARRNETEADREARRLGHHKTQLAVALYRLGATPLNPEAEELLARVRGIQ